MLSKHRNNSLALRRKKGRTIYENLLRNIGTIVYLLLFSKITLECLSYLFLQEYKNGYTRLCIINSRWCIGHNRDVCNQHFLMLQFNEVVSWVTSSPFLFMR